MTEEQKKTKMEEVERIERQISELTDDLWARRLLLINQIDAGRVPAVPEIFKIGDPVIEAEDDGHRAVVAFLDALHDGWAGKVDVPEREEK